MPQSTAAVHLKERVIRALRNPQGTVPAPKAGIAHLARPVWAKKPYTTVHGTCVAVEVRQKDQLWVQVRTPAGEDAWAPAQRILNPEDRRRWAQTGFG